MKFDFAEFFKSDPETVIQIHNSYRDDLPIVIRFVTGIHKTEGYYSQIEMEEFDVFSYLSDVHKKYLKGIK